MSAIEVSTWQGAFVGMPYPNRDISRPSTESRDTSRMIPPPPCGTVDPMAAPEAERLRPALRTFFERIAKERGISRSRLCTMAKVSESTVRAFLSGQTKTMRHDTLEK